MQNKLRTRAIKSNACSQYPLPLPLSHCLYLCWLQFNYNCIFHPPCVTSLSLSLSLSPRWRHKICSFIFTWILPGSLSESQLFPPRTPAGPNTSDSVRLPPFHFLGWGLWNIFGSCRQRLRLVNLLPANAYLSHLQRAWRRHSTIYKQLGSSRTAATAPPRPEGHINRGPTNSATMHI